MLIPTIVMGLLAVVLIFTSYNKGGGEHILGLKAGGSECRHHGRLLDFVVLVGSF